MPDIVYVTKFCKTDDLRLGARLWAFEEIHHAIER